MVSCYLTLIFSLCLSYTLPGFAQEASLLRLSISDQKLLRNLYNQGTNLYYDGAFEEAVNVFSEILKLNGNIMEAHLNIGAAQQRSGKIKQAKQSYRKAMKSKPALAESNPLDPASYYCTLLVQEARQRRQHLMTYRDTKEGRDETTKWKWENQGPPRHMSMPLHRDEKTAIKLCSYVSKKLPDSFYASRILGYLYDAIEYTEKSIDAFNRSILISRKALASPDVTQKERENNEFNIGLCEEVMMAGLNRIFSASQYRWDEKDIGIHAIYRMAQQQPNHWGHYFNLGLIYSYGYPWSPLVRYYYRVAEDMAVESIEKQREKQYAKRQRKFIRRTAIHSFLNVDGVHVTELKPVDDVWTWIPGKVYELGQVLKRDFFVLHNGRNKMPVRHNERYIFLAKIGPARVEGKSGVIYNDMFVWLGNHGTRPGDYKAGTDRKQEITRIKEPVLYVGLMNMVNYYHVMGELVSRWALAEYVLFKKHPRMKFLFGNREGMELAIAELIGLKEDQYIIYDPLSDPDPQADSGNRVYHFDELYVLDWEMPPEMPPGHPGIVAEAYNESWKIYHGPQIGIKLARDMLITGYERNGDHFPRRRHSLLDPPKVVYASRADARVIRHIRFEKWMIRILENILGCIPLRIVIHDRDGAAFGYNYYAMRRDSKKTGKTSLRDQMRLFGNADLVIGPHGMALTNLVFARNGTKDDPGAALMYFPMLPQTDNCFSNMAAALSQQIYPVDSFEAYYLAPFKITEVTEQVEHAIYVLKKILKARGWWRHSHFCHKKCSSAEPWYRFFEEEFQ